MSKAEIQKTFVNKTLVDIDTLSGKTVHNNNCIFDSNVKVYGRMGHKPYGLPLMDKGTYFIEKDGTVLTKWDHWDFAKQFSFNVYQTKNAYINVVALMYIIALL